MKSPARILLLLAAFFLTACEAPGGLGGGGATLLVTGPDVTVNGARATHGMPLRSGDKLETGAASSALVRWRDGTTLQLDAATDPLVRYDGSVIALNIAFGWFMIDTSDYSVWVENSIVRGQVNSRVAIQVLPDRRTDVFVLRGSFELQSPPGRRVVAGQRASVGASGAVSYAAITPAEARSIEGRFGRWRFPPVASPIRFDIVPTFNIPLGGGGRRTEGPYPSGGTADGAIGTAAGDSMRVPMGSLLGGLVAGGAARPPIVPPR